MSPWVIPYLPFYPKFTDSAQSFIHPLSHKGWRFSRVRQFFFGNCLKFNILYALERFSTPPHLPCVPEDVLIQWAGCVSGWWLHRPWSSFCNLYSQTRKFPEQPHLRCRLRLVCPAQSHYECNTWVLQSHCILCF